MIIHLFFSVEWPCFFLSRYVRTDSCFWNLPWELRHTSLTPHPPRHSCLPTATWTHKSPPNRLHSLQQTLLWHSNVSPFHLPTALLHLAQSHLHVFPGQRWRQGHQVVSLHLPACVCTRVCVCVPLRLECFHTHTTRGERMNADETVSDTKKGFFCSTTTCSCRKFAFAHTEQFLWGLHTVWCCIQLFFPSQIKNTAGNLWLGWHFFLVFWCINVSFTYLPQIFFQTCENTLGKFEETTWTSIDITPEGSKGSGMSGLLQWRKYDWCTCWFIWPLNWTPKVSVKTTCSVLL